MPQDAIPVIVVGAGHLGSRHARIYSELSQAKLVGVADLIPERAHSVAGELGVSAVTDFRELLPRVRAASVTVPTVAHWEVSRKLLDAGIDVLVEKPIAADLDEAEAMIAAAREGGRVLGVGHSERFNPAVEAVMDGVGGGARFIEVHRLASFSPRSLDIDVVLDLMIHDLDIVATLVGSEVSRVEAIGVPVLSERADIANARLRFQSGCVANLTASRISQERMRKLRVWRKDCYLSVDYLAQETWSYRLVPGAGRPEIEREKLSPEAGEPLVREIADFLDAVRERRSPRVPGEDGLRALRLARDVKRAMDDGA